jgi:hypothetical protein
VCVCARARARARACVLAGVRVCAYGWVGGWLGGCARVRALYAYDNLRE